VSISAGGWADSRARPGCSKWAGPTPTRTLGYAWALGLSWAYASSGRLGHLYACVGLGTVTGGLRVWGQGRVNGGARRVIDLVSSDSDSDVNNIKRQWPLMEQEDRGTDN
jgi:hypothetical protein